MRPRRNMRPADMTFTEDEVYGAPDAWDASDEPDAFSPLEMIQPGAEDVSDVDDPDLDAWIAQTAEPPSTIDVSGIRPLGEVDASGIAPLNEEPAPQMQPVPRAASLRKLSMQMRDGGSDDGYGAAEAQARNAYSGGLGWRALAAFLDPAGAAQRDAAAYDRAQQPIEAWKMQTARREQRSAREADQAAKMQKLAQDMRAQEAREAAQRRALDIREQQADPNSEWNKYDRTYSSEESDRRAARDAGLSLEAWKAHQADLDRRARMSANATIIAGDKAEARRIAAEDRALRRSLDEEERSQNIPGLEHDPSVRLPPSEVSKVRDTIERTNKINSEVENVIGAFREIGGVEALAGNVDMLASDRVAAADASTAELQGMARELANFGTPTGGELAIAARRLPSVTSATNRGTIEAKYRAFQRLAEQTRSEVERLRGYRRVPPPAPRPAAATGARRIDPNDVAEVLE